MNALLLHRLHLAFTITCHYSMIGSFSSNATTTVSPSARTASMKELFSRANSVLRGSLALLASVTLVCLRVFVFAAIVLWPWESAW
jgi:hypothetical protein